ncbi:MAG: glycosyltransferase family 39 protein [Candidatus Komeilibacteria bacterium]
MSTLKRIVKHPLTWIIFLAAVLRLWQLGAADVITDEVFYAFRGLGYLDYDVGLTQTSPIQWLDARPWWSWLSFHDHPPLIFLINYICLKLGGVSTWVIRLPAFLAGIGSVLVVYLIGSLKNRQVAIIASLLLAVSAYHVWISRIGLQESPVIFFFLLTTYYYLRWTQNGLGLKSWGLAWGFLWLTKFTGFIMAPIIISHQLLVGQFKFRWLQLIRAGLVALALFSPVIIYNLALLIKFGHFDFQFSFLLGQQPDAWSTHKGKDLGTVADKLSLLNANLFTGESAILAIVMVAASLLLIAIMAREIWWRKKAETLGLYVVLALIWQIVTLAFIGGTERFTAILIPWLVLALALVLEPWLTKKWLWLSLTLVMLISAFGSINSFWFNQPIVTSSVFSSSLRVNSAQWGYNQLDSYLNEELSGKKPSLTFPTRYTWLEVLRRKALAGQGQPAPILLVYDQRLDQLASLWYLHRRLVYEGWPVIPAMNFLQESGGNIEYWHSMGFQTIYLIEGQNTLFDPQQIAKIDLNIPDGSVDLVIDTKEIATPDGIRRFAVRKINIK